MREFDHSEKDVLKACKVSEEELIEAAEELPVTLNSRFELVELMCKAGHNPAKNLALFFAFLNSK